MKVPESFSVKIKTSSKRARIAAIKLGGKKVAMVWGNTILLAGTTREEFLSDKKWVCHELRHVLQSMTIGKWRFLLRYVFLSIQFGYHNHPYEVDARLHEQDEEILKRVKWL
jgi:hypothetical protein